MPRRPIHAALLVLLFLVLSRPADAQSCIVDGDCVDGDPCTVGFCNAGSCDYFPQDRDGDGQCDLGDACPTLPDSGGPLAFHEMIVASPRCADDPFINCAVDADCPTGVCLRAAFEWATPLPYAYAAGNFASSSDTFALFADVDAGRGFGTTYASAADPAPGTGHWFLMRPDCPLGSWQTDIGTEPDRDVNRPTSQPFEYAVEVAHAEALDRWGGDGIPGDPVPTYDAHGNVSSWLFPVGLSGTPLPDPQTMADFIDSVALGLDRGDPALLDALESEWGPLATIQTGASLEDYPILSIAETLDTAFLYPAYARLETEALTGEPTLLQRYVFESPHEEFFDVYTDNHVVRLHAYTMIEQGLLEPLPLDGMGGGGSRQQAWEQAAWSDRDEASTRSVTVNFVPHADRMPVINWTCWCAPTAASMVAGYWDHLGPSGTHVGYGRGIDHWHQRQCTNPSQSTNIPNFMGELMNYGSPSVCPGSCSWSPNGMETILNTLNGYGFTWDNLVGKKNNDFRWAELKAEIDAGRPAMWGVGPQQAHAMAAYGYREADGNKYVYVHSTWGTTRKQQVREFRYDQWAGGKIGNSSVGRLTPGSPDPAHAYLTFPRGGETVFGPTTITWNVSGNGSITKTDVFLSDDSGNTWNLLVPNVATTTGSNSTSWNFSSPSTDARIRIDAKDASNQLIAADGSFGDFTIDVEPDLVPVPTSGGFYCRQVGSNLEVEVRNAGTASAGASQTRVAFSGATTSTMSTPMLAPGASTTLLFPIPAGCFNPVCDFTITVDVNGAVTESNESNNQVTDSCFS